MKKLLLLIVCVSVLFCGCGKTEIADSSVEATVSETEIAETDVETEEADSAKATEQVEKQEYSDVYVEIFGFERELYLEVLDKILVNDGRASFEEMYSGENESEELNITHHFYNVNPSVIYMVDVCTSNDCVSGINILCNANATEEERDDFIYFVMLTEVAIDSDYAEQILVELGIIDRSETQFASADGVNGHYTYLVDINDNDGLEMFSVSPR